jgi:hypothetical protein
MGIPPTGKSVTVTGFDLFRIEGGKITEMWLPPEKAGSLRPRPSVRQKRAGLLGKG